MLLPLAAALQLLLLLHGLGQVSLAANNYELRFQSESETNGTRKQVSQQQTFKCQVRLAPVPTNPVKPQRNQHLVVSQRPLAPNELELLNLTSFGAGSKWPANVSLSIGWLKDGQELAAGAEQVGVVNVELAKSKSATATTTSAMKNDKKNRIEIKNTLNEGQLKLTSRLKLGHLRASDSGQYKCLAQAKFLHHQEAVGKSMVVVVEQALESNGSRLVVEPAIVSLPASDQVVASHNGHNNRNGSRRLDAAAALDRPAGRSGNEPEQKGNGNWNGKPHNDMQHASEPATFEGTTTVTSANEMGGPDNDDRSRARLFEDDEDLFRLEQAERIEFISAKQPAANDDEDGGGGGDQWKPSAPSLVDRHQANDPLVTTDGPQDEWWAESLAAARPDSNNESSSSAKSTNTNNNHYHHHTNDNQHQGAIHGISGIASGRQHLPVETNYQLAGGYLVGSLDSTRLRLVKLVHRMAPELGCYTGLGEHYRGNLSEAADGRRCLLWPARATQAGRRTPKWRWELSDNNHNHCRNPNMDPRGPWCFVRAAGAELVATAPIARSNAPAQREQQQLASSWASANGSSHYVVVATPCNVSPCSQYLWLYIVAPPVGLIASLLCLVAILVRAIRRSRYNSVFAAGKRRPHLPAKLGKLLTGSQRCKRRFAPKKLISPKPGPRHLDEDDAFEIVHDLDWSEGQQLSDPSRSTTESLKLNSSFSSDSSACCKSTNQMLASDTTNGNKASRRSVTQVGPVFATLRCHIRAGLGKQQLALQQQRQHNKSSTFIEQCGEPLEGRKTKQQPYGGGKQHDPSCWHNSPGTSDSTISSSANSPDRRSGAQAGHLISCSTTSDDFTNAVDLSSLGAAAYNKCILASELPQLKASSVALAHDRQPIYEGKFSQVLVAYVVQACEGAHQLQAGAQVGTQVAVQALKINAAIDPTLFAPANIKLHNLNHLNLLKLIGWAQLVGDDLELRQQVTCSLIYDMAQLVDLNDWIQQQAQDIKTSSQEPGTDLGIRRNLTCLAKQIALALDYLHDLNIVYKDLACRNCFLDPTKMLVKLASFNAELVLSQSDDKTQNLKSMIRPKYLLDYYVIDTRPSDSQLLPLSWIPLESILFNKFNKQTDVWSFGCLIHELFSLGGVAYFGYSSKQIIDAVRSNLMPPQPLLCPNGIYKLMCKCLSDIPAIRPNVKQIYEQLNLYSGQCSSFLDHHLCSLATAMCDDSNISSHLIDLKLSNNLNASTITTSDTNSITKTKSYANIKHLAPPTTAMALSGNAQYDNLVPLALESQPKSEAMKLPMSKSINLDANRLMSFGRQNNNNGNQKNQELDANHYDEPVVEAREREQE